MAETGKEREEVERAEEEARRVGGEVEPLSEDPAEEPVVEAGGGESEGFEQAERRLEEIAEHGDERGFPDRDVPAPEEPEGTERGEADEATPPDS